MKSFFEKLYFASILLVILPSLSLSPFISNSHTLVGLIWGILMVYVFIKNIKEKNVFYSKKNLFILLFSIFFLSQSISVITAVNLDAFISAYIKIIFIAIFFVISIHFIKDNKSIKKIIKILFASSVVSILLQTIMFLNYNLFLYLGGLFLNKSYLELISLNIQRGRIYLETYDEVLIPIILYYWIANKNRKILLFFVFMIPVISFFSLFRTKIIMLLFSIISSTLIFLKKIKSYYLVLLIIGLSLISLYLVLSNFQYYTVVDRLTLQNQSDRETISSRIERWGFALDMGISSPAFGVGLGNYYDYLPPNKQKSISPYQIVNQAFDVASKDPHNVFFSTFAETGVFGISTFVLLLCYFAAKDLEVLRRKKYGLTKAFIVSFWSLFIYSVFNPSSSITYQSLFWLLRVVLYKLPLLENKN